MVIKNTHECSRRRWQQRQEVWLSPIGCAALRSVAAVAAYFQLLFKDRKLMVQMVISSAVAGGLAEWVLMELQGEIEAHYSTGLAGNLLGDRHH